MYIDPTLPKVNLFIPQYYENRILKRFLVTIGDVQSIH